MNRNELLSWVSFEMRLKIRSRFLSVIPFSLPNILFHSIRFERNDFFFLLSIRYSMNVRIFKLMKYFLIVFRFMWFMIKVTFGEHDRCDDKRRPETRFVLRAISQQFSFSNFDNDIALLRLNDRVPITDFIRPICLPSKQGEFQHPTAHLFRQRKYNFGRF